MGNIINPNNVLLAIPARGGSKRLPGKNLAILEGKPVLVYTIEAAINSGLAQEVYVCTEDDEIAHVAGQFGAKVFSIPYSMAGDEVSSTVPCLALYDRLNREGVVIDYIFNLQATSPLRTGEDIRSAYDTLKQSDADFLVSTTSIDPHYFHWALAKEHERWTMFFGEKYLKERTMLPPVYRPNGAIKLGKASRVKETGHFFGDLLTTYEMPEERSIHLATQFDFSCIQKILQEFPSSRISPSAITSVETFDKTDTHGNKMFKLEGKKCNLAAFDEWHLNSKDYLRWLRDYEVVKTINRMDYLRPVSFSEVKSYCETVMQSKNDIFLAIYDKEDDLFIGTLRCAKIDWYARTADIGILIGEKNYWGKGIATDAIATLSRYLFEKLALRKLTAGLMDVNPAMLAVFKKIGFKEEGHFRKQDRYEDGYVDHIYLGCFREEFESLDVSTSK